MTKLTIDLPTTIKVALGKDSGQYLAIETKRLPANVVEAIFTAGAKVILTNCFNGEGKDAKFDERKAKATKKLDAWYRGEFNITSHGDSFMKLMREAYIDDVRAKTGGSVSDVEQSIKATVKAHFGEKESATFGRFLDALAIDLSKAADMSVDEARDALEAKYQALADEAAKKRSAVEAKLDVSALALADFLKPTA